MLPRLLVVLSLVAAAACDRDRSAPSKPPPRDAGVAVRHDAAAPADAAVDPRIAAGAAHYARLCAQCHGADGRGYVADNAPSLVSRTFLESADDAYLAGSIALGRPGTAMGAYGVAKGGPLDDAAIAELVAFLRSRGPAAAPLPPAGKGDPARGAEVWKASCQTCHGDRTNRATAVHLGNPVLLAQASDAFLRHAIVHGRPGTPMEAFGGKLTDAQIDDVVALIRSWAAPADPTNPPAPEPPPTTTTTKPPAPPADGPVVLNPKGKAPSFTLRDGKYVSVDQVAKALASGKRIVIADARPASDWLRERIAGAVSTPYYQPESFDRLPKDGTWIVAYCACPHHLSGIVVDELRKRGYANTAVLDEGINVWRQKGHPVEGTAHP